MVIDFHTHIFPDAIAQKSIASLERVAGIQASTDGTLDGLLRSMEEAGVDLSVILPVVTKPSQFDTVNRFAASVNQRYKGRLLSFGGIHPDCEDPEEKLSRIKALGLPGIKLHPDYQGVMIDDPRYMRIIEIADALDLIIMVHAGVDIGLPDPVHCPPEKSRRVLESLRPKKLILAHYGGWKQWDQVEELLAGQEVYLDTAFTLDAISREQFLRIYQKHDKSKILFATDSPWGAAKRDVESFRQLPLSPEEKEAVFAGNALALLGRSA